MSNLESRLRKLEEGQPPAPAGMEPPPRTGEPVIGLFGVRGEF